MKVFVLEIHDGNGCRLVIKLNKDDALQDAQDWLNTRPGGLDPHYQSWFNDCMDNIQAGNEVRLANMDYINLNEAEIDLGFVIQALEDTQFTLGKVLNSVKVPNGSADPDGTIASRCLATEQVVHHTLKKLKGQS